MLQKEMQEILGAAFTRGQSLPNPLFPALPSQSTIPSPHEKANCLHRNFPVFPPIRSKHVRLQFYCTALCSRVVIIQPFCWSFITSYFDEFYSYGVKAQS